jgi:hypothetical protein
MTCGRIRMGSSGLIWDKEEGMEGMESGVEMLDNLRRSESAFAERGFDTSKYSPNYSLETRIYFFIILNCINISSCLSEESGCKEVNPRLFLQSGALWK